MDENKKYIILGGVALVVIVVLILRKTSGSSGPTIIQSGSTSDLSPTQERVTLAGINAGTFKDILGFSLASQQNKSGETVALAQTSAGRDIALGEQSTSVTLANSSNSLDLARAQIAERLGVTQINAQRDVGLADASAQSLAAQNQNANALSNLRALQNYQAAQNRAAATQSALSGLSSLLRALTAQKPNSPASGSGGGQPQVSNTNTPITRKNVPRRSGIPALDLALNKLLDDNYVPANPDFPELDYGAFNDYQNNYSDFLNANPDFAPWDLVPDTSVKVIDDLATGYYDIIDQTQNTPIETDTSVPIDYLY